MKNSEEIEDIEEEWDRTPISVLWQKSKEDYVWAQFLAGVSKEAMEKSVGWSRKRLNRTLHRLKKVREPPRAPVPQGCTFGKKVTPVHLRMTSASVRTPRPRARLSQDDIRRLVRLYQHEGYGLKRLAKEFGITPRAVKKRLQALNVYQGVFKAGCSGHRSVLLNASTWQTVGGATVQSDSEGLRVYLPNAEAEVHCTVAQVGRRTVRIYVQLIPLSAQFESLRFGLRSGQQEAEVPALVQRVPDPVPPWTVAVECQDAVTLFLRGVPGKLRAEFCLPNVWLEFGT